MSMSFYSLLTRLKGYLNVIKYFIYYFIYFTNLIYYIYFILFILLLLIHNLNKRKLLIFKWHLLTFLYTTKYEYTFSKTLENFNKFHYINLYIKQNLMFFFIILYINVLSLH